MRVFEIYEQLISENFTTRTSTMLECKVKTSIFYNSPHSPGVKLQM